MTNELLENIIDGVTSKVDADGQGSIALCTESFDIVGEVYITCKLSLKGYVTVVDRSVSGLVTLNVTKRVEYLDKLVNNIKDIMSEVKKYGRCVRMLDAYKEYNVVYNILYNMGYSLDGSPTKELTNQHGDLETYIILLIWK